MTKLIVGLGNPGTRYERTRHNAGFLVVDALADAYHLSWSKKLFINTLVAEGNVDGAKVILAKPQTFMNRSGQAVAKLMKRYKLTADDLVIVYDDVDIERGSIRWREEGSAGGHNGLKSIIQLIGTQQFPRLRIGIGKPPERVPLEDYVLGKMNKEEQASLPISEAVNLLIEKIA